MYKSTLTMINKCLHCGLPSPINQKFCCNGCNAAYSIINNLGLGNYYKSRFIKTGERSNKPEENNFINIEEFAILSDNNSYSVNLMVEGLHCAACIWLIESVLKKQENIIKARINMGNRRLHLIWNGDLDYGNKLVKMVADLGYRLIPFDAEILKNEEKKYDNNLLKALAVSGFAAGNIMLLSVALWSSSSEIMGIATRNLLYWVSALIALPTIIYSGRIFFASAWNAVKSGTTNMDVPIAIAIFLASLVSLFEAITKGEHAYFDSAVMLIFFLLIGRYLDFGARKKAMQTASQMALLQVSAATLIDENNQPKTIRAKDIKKDMILLIVAGDRIPADGIVIDGISEIDTSLITGESMPKKISINEEVFAGMINLAAPIKIMVNKTKEETLLAQIIALTENIEKNKSRYVRIADKVSKYYTPIVHILAAISFIIWCFYLKAGWHQSLLIATAVLIITCPCALALAVPVVQIVSSSRLMKQGILLKSGEALEKLTNIDSVVFDKTGTLTLGQPKLINKNEIDENLLLIAASVASKSKHPLSKALCNSYSGNLLELQVSEIMGSGLSSIYNNQAIKLGKKEFATDLNEENNNEITSEVYLKYGDKTVVFKFEDELRPDAELVKKQLQKLKKKIILLSGDKKSAVENVANKVGITEYYYNQTPIDKCDFLKQLKSQNKNILMIGDGLNDAPALALADVSISPSIASDISKNAANIIFQGQKLYPVLEVILVAKKAKKLMKENFVIALAYNLIAVPFAIVGYIVPLIAALAMSSSSIIVVLNALRIKDKKSKIY